MDDERLIEVSQGKIIQLLVLGVIFGVLSGWVLLLDDDEIRTLRPGASPTWINGIAGVGVAGAIGCLIYGVRRFVDKRPGLVLSPRGMVDNSSAVAAGFIPWSDITGFSIFEMKRAKMLIILVRDPESYVQRGGALKRALNRANMKMVGSPLSISANTLKIKFDELQQLLESYRARYSAAA